MPQPRAVMPPLLRAIGLAVPHSWALDGYTTLLVRDGAGLAEAVGRSRTATTNLLRLLTLTPEVKAMLKERKLEMGHARALLALDAAEQVLAAKEVVAKALSVRQTEDLIRRMKEKQPVRQKFVVKTRDDIRLEESLAETLGAVVKLSANSKGKGRIVIEFTNLDQLEGIVHRIQQQGH